MAEEPRREWFEKDYYAVLGVPKNATDAEIKKVVSGAPEVVDGYFHLSDKPGLGVELDVDAAAEFPQQQARFDLWAEGWEQRKPKGTE